MQQALHFAKSIVDVRSEIEALEISFETLVGKDMAKTLFAQLRKFAVDTPLLLNDLARGAQMLLSFNIPADRVMTILKQIGDISMGNAQKFNSLTLAFSQMFSTGRLMGQDLLQMINAGFNPLTVMSEKTGKSVAQLKKEMEGGSISAEMVAKAFADATGEGGKFNGMLEKQSQGIQGLKSNLQGAWEDMLNDLGTKSQGFISYSIQWSTDVVKSYDKIGEALAVLIATYGAYKAAVIATEVIEKSCYQARLAQMAGMTKMQVLTDALRTKTAALNKTLLANPYAIAAAAVVALGYGIYKLATYQSDAEKTASKLNDTIKEGEKATQAERYEIDLMFNRLKAAKSGAEEYESAKQAIISQYGKYLSKLGDEKNALNDIAAAYKLITEEATKAANARAMQQVISDAGEEKSDESSKAYDKIGKLLKKKFGDKQGGEYLLKLKPVIMDGAEITAEMQEIIRQFDVFHNARYEAESGIKVMDEYTSNAITGRLDALAKVWHTADNKIKEATDKFGAAPAPEGDAVFDAEAAYLQQLMTELPKAKIKLEELKAADKPDPAAIAAKELEIQQIKDQTAAREKELTVIKDVKAQIELLQKEQEKYGKDDAEYKALGVRIKSLKTKLPKTEGSEGKTETEAARIKRETAERTQKIQEYENAIAKQARQSELDIAQARIEAMDEGYAREQAQNELAYQRLIFANEQREAEMVRALQTARELEWENKNPKAKAKGETFDRSTVTAADLSPEQQKMIQEYAAIANKFREKSEADLLKSLLDKYRDYEQQRTDINKRFNEERTAIENSSKSAEAKAAAIAVLEKKRKEEIKAVNDEEVESMQKTSDLFVKLFSDASQKSVRELRSIITTTEELISYLAQTKPADITPKFGFTAEQLKTLQESPEKLKALKQLNGELGDRSPFEKFANDIDKAIEKIKSGDIGGGLEGIGSSIQAIMPTVKQFGDDLGAIFGDSQIGEDIGILTELIGGVGKGIQGIGQIASGDILGGVTNIVSGIASIFSMANAAAERHREALEAVMNAKIDQQREYNLLLLKQNLLYEKGTTIFGNDGYGKAINAIEVYKKALDDLNQAIAGTAAQKKAQSSQSHLLALFGIKDAQSALKQIYAGLADIEIVTGHKKTGLFGWGKGKDLYSSVLSVYPDLIAANGEFNKELAQTIINTRKMSDEDRNALQNMVNLYEQYEEAMQSVRDYLGGIFGDLGNTMSDALVDAFKNGSDAADAFKKSVSKMLEDLAQQMIYSVTLAPIMEKAQEQMLDVMKNGGLTDAEKFAQYANILSNLTDEAIAQQGIANNLYQQYQDMAAQKGIDIFQPDKEREADRGGLTAASQDSVDYTNGQLTLGNATLINIREGVKTVQEDVHSMRSVMAELYGNSAAILAQVQGIRENTDTLPRYLPDMAEGIDRVGAKIDDLMMRGVKIK